MATAAFKSTTKRTQVGSQENNTSLAAGNNSGKPGSKPAGGHRRSRSLSHFGRYSSEISSSAYSVLRQIDIDNKDEELSDKPSDSSNVSPIRGSNVGPFVNTVRGSSAAVDSPPVRETQRGRSVSRHQTDIAADNYSEAEKLQRRGRSVNRYGASNHTANPSNDGRRRQRSVSVVRQHQYSDSTSESDMDATYQWTSSNRPKNNAAVEGQRHISEKLSGRDVVKPQRGLRRCSSQTDLSRSYDNHSSYGSSLTDDEGLDVTHNDQGEEKIIRAVYAQMKSLRSDHPTGDMDAADLLEAMRSEVRNAIAELKNEIKQTGAQKNTQSATSKGSSDLLKPKSADVRKNYTAKLEQSEKRTRNLRTELAVEEQRRQELGKILKELLSGPKPAQTERPSRRRRNSADRKQLSKSLNEEAQKYIDEFLSMPNMEDSELSSSFEEEQYNATSHGRKIEDTGICQESLQKIENAEKCSHSTQHVPLSVEDDGVVLPWLEWETNPDSPPQFSRADLEAVMTEKTVQNKFAEEVGSSSSFDGNVTVTSNNYSSGSWTPDSNHQLNISKHDSSITTSLNLSSTRNSREIRSQEYKSNLKDSVKLLHDHGRFPKSTYLEDDYISHVNNEVILMEKLKLENRIQSGGIFLCCTNLL
ncbi:hypothetical protein SUGI_0074350 [Cryptomeria japonica]|uniref:uncharacterized protein LOC131029157 isoform X2 n=1 Tax=Cryptomeria japonica TaxID=3369 RepID=UPI0024089A94|nr:uncharacterized protein LOC131029157 isoform X2 [Cryptomeria japonica]GLJ07803.1 hypothetical protein SUGI_0074350 [Cryptomeria japonica]